MINGFHKKGKVVQFYQKPAKPKCGPDIGPDVINISPRNRKERIGRQTNMHSRKSTILV